MPGLDALIALKDRAKEVKQVLVSKTQSEVPRDSGVQYEEFELEASKINNLKYAGVDDTMDEGYEREKPPLRKIDQYLPPDCPCCNITKRFTMAILASIGFLISFGIRCNMGVAVVEMTSNQTLTGKREIDWSDDIVGVVDSSFFWGYIITQVPGGLIASRFPAHRVFGTAIATSSLLNMLIPGASRLHPVAVISVRVLQGLVEGVTYPACHGIWRNWAPPLERSRLATLAPAESYARGSAGMPLLPGSRRHRWPAPFYVYAGFWLSSNFVFTYYGNGSWLLVIFVFIPIMRSRKPATHPTISRREQVYIEESLGKRTIPSSMNNSIPIPFHNKNNSKTKTFSPIPVPVPRTIPIPRPVPIPRTRNKHDPKTIMLSRKTLERQRGFELRFNVNHLDIAPRYASILMGISNGFGTLSGMICPIIVEEFTKHSAAEPRDYAPPNPHNPFASAAPPPTNPFSAGFTQEAVQPTSQQYTQGQY
nr:vesicular glutamate transporter 1-like [Penaeus vannamei]